MEVQGEREDRREEIRHEREMRRAERKTDRTRTLIVVAAVALAFGLAAVWNRYSINQSQHRFCDYIQTQSTAAQGTIDPPGTAGRKAAESAAQLYADLGCTD